MTERLDQHGSQKFNELCSKRTRPSPAHLAEIVDKHAGDAVFLGTENDGDVKGADGGLSDFVGSMTERDPERLSTRSRTTTTRSPAMRSAACRHLRLGGGSSRVASAAMSRSILARAAFRSRTFPDRAIPNMNRAQAH